MNENLLTKLKELKQKDKKEFKQISLKDNELLFLLNNSFIINDFTILVKYDIIKNYANPNIFDIIINHLLKKIRYIIQQHNKFQMHIDLHGYTITSHERIKNLYNQLFIACEQDNILFSEKLTIMNIYNCPLILRSLNSFFAPFINKTARAKINLYNKIDSEKMLLENSIV